MNENYNTPNSGCCGRPMHYDATPKCNYNSCCMNEYAYKQKACIRNKQPDCEAQAVIPSITVETVDGITNLANCLVHVTSTNTTYYVDDKHRIMITWAGPVNIPGYDMEGNPEGFKDQIVTDTEAGIAVIYDKNGVGYTFGIQEGLDVQEEINNKLDAMVEAGTLQRILNSPATTENLGGVIIGDGLQVDENGKVDVKAGSNITVDENGVSETPYSDYIEDIDALEYDYENALTSTKTHINYSIISSDYTPKIVMSDPDDPDVIKRASEFDFEYKPTLMNNLFAWNTNTHETYGPLIIDNDIKVENNLSGGTGWTRPIVAIDDNGKLHNINGNTSASSVGYKNAFRAWYCLFNNGDTNPNIGSEEHEPRTFLAQDVNGNWLVGVCGGRKVDDTGMVFSDIIDFINNTLSFNAVLIYSLDGGGSSNFLYHGIRQNKLVDREDRACPNWLVWSSDTAKHEGLFKNQSINNLEYIEKTHDNDGHLMNKNDIVATYTINERVTINANSRMFQICPRILNMNINFTVTGEGNLSGYSHIIEGLPHTFGNAYFVILNVDTGEVKRGYLYQGTNTSELRNRDALAPGAYVVNFTVEVDEMY